MPSAAHGDARLRERFLGRASKWCRCGQSPDSGIIRVSTVGDQPEAEGSTTSHPTKRLSACGRTTLLPGTQRVVQYISDRG